MMAGRPKNEKLHHFQGHKMAAKETICRKGENTNCVYNYLILAVLGGWPINVSGNRSLDV